MPNTHEMMRSKDANETYFKEDMVGKRHKGKITHTSNPNCKIQR